MYFKLLCDYCLINMLLYLFLLENINIYIWLHTGFVLWFNSYIITIRSQPRLYWRLKSEKMIPRGNSPSVLWLKIISQIHFYLLPFPALLFSCIMDSSYLLIPSSIRSSLGAFSTIVEDLERQLFEVTFRLHMMTFHGSFWIVRFCILLYARDYSLSNFPKLSFFIFSIFTFICGEN